MPKETTLLLIFLFLSTLTNGQKKNPILKHISSYIITESDTIKIQRMNKTERDKLFEIGSHSYPSTQSLLVAVTDIEDFLNSKSQGKNPNGYDYRYDSFDIRLNKLIGYAKDYEVYFDLENYKKENWYYVNYPLKNGERKSIKEIFREIDLETERRAKEWAIQKRNDSISTIQKTINDSLENIKHKQEIKNQIAINAKQKKQAIETKARQKIENKKKKNERRISIINRYGSINGEAILNHRVKIGWTKSMCIASWGKPRDINRTTTTYGSHEQYVYSLKRYLYFENGILTAIQD